MSSNAVAALPRVSVVIPAYRAEATIARTIDSLLAQEGVNLQIIVVIDGTFDRTTEIVESYSGHPVTIEEHATNRGAAISRNDGLALVQTEFVMFLDADDFLEGPLLAALAAAMMEEGADIGFGPMQIFHQQLDRRDPKFVPDFRDSVDIFRRWHLEGVYVSPCSVLWRTDFIRRIGGWDPEVTRNDDGELVMRAILLGGKFAVTGDGRGVYVKHSSQSLNNRTDNMSSMLVVNEKLLALNSPVIDRDLQQHVCAGHYFNIACHSYLAGRDDLGDEALARSRRMGFGSRGPLLHRIMYRLLGVKLTSKLARRIKQVKAR